MPTREWWWGGRRGGVILTVVAVGENSGTHGITGPSKSDYSKRREPGGVEHLRLVECESGAYRRYRSQQTSLVQQPAPHSPLLAASRNAYMAYVK